MLNYVFSYNEIPIAKVSSGSRARFVCQHTITFLVCRIDCTFMTVKEGLLYGPINIYVNGQYNDII